jgi:chromosome segregation ATPase
MREECQAIAEKIKPLLEELKELHLKLKEAIEAGDEGAAEEIKMEIQAVTDEIRAIKEEMAESDCLPAISPKVRKRLEIARENCKKMLEKTRERIRSNVERRRCVKGEWKDLSEEDREAMESINADIAELGMELREAMEQVDDDKVAEIRGQIAELVEKLRNLFMEKGLANCFSS